MLLAIRMMWKDWGFASTLFAQAKMFLDLAKASEHTAQEGHIRAAIVFFLMAFEASFLDAVRSYIYQKGSGVDAGKLGKVERELKKGSPIWTALKTWPELLVGTALDTGSKCYDDFDNFRAYRNTLVHGKIAEPTGSSWGKTAQEFETVAYAEMSRDTVSAMIKLVAGHFGQPAPTWI